MRQQYSVIYHRLDWDGKMAGAAVLFWLLDQRGVKREDITMIGWDYHDPMLGPVPDDHILYMVDISCEPLMVHPGLIWIDHHKTAIEQFNFAVPIPGYRIDGVAACRLVWQWFRQKAALNQYIELPQHSKDYTDRLVSEPLLIRLVGEFDIWDKRDPRAEWLQCALTLKGFHTDNCLNDVGFWDDRTCDELVEIGKPLYEYKQKTNTETAQAQAFILEWEDLRFLVLNTALGNSLALGEVAFALNDSYDAIMLWRFDGNRARFSLYSKPSGTVRDLSEIAVKHGGGGHRGACGFSVALNYAASEIFLPSKCTTLKAFKERLLTELERADRGG